MRISYSAELETACRAARAAGEIIAGHYRGEYRVSVKSDRTRVTEVDLEADRCIREMLAAEFPDDARLSEETEDSPERLGAQRVWIVDPVDGTDDFIDGTDEFCTMVGLAVEGRAVVGAVYLPVTGELFYAEAGRGAWREGPDGERERLRVTAVGRWSEARVLVSRTRGHEELSRFYAGMGVDARDIVAQGSGGVKMTTLAAGRADIYVCPYGSPAEWDTCAPGLILTEAGGRMIGLDGRPLAYNQAQVKHSQGFVADNGHLAEPVLAAGLPIQ